MGNPQLTFGEQRKRPQKRTEGFQNLNNVQRRLRKQVRHREGNHPRFFICLKAADPVAQGTLENNERERPHTKAQPLLL